MILESLPIGGAYLIRPTPYEDERGCFARTYCEETFRKRGLQPVANQCSVSFNRHAGTLRGMHYQVAPHGEAKLVRATRGAVYDVLLDLRPDSLTCLKWHAVKLTAQNRFALYVPEGCAHGFLTIEDNTEVFYQINTAFAPGAARGVRWNDPAFGIEWPQTVQVISERDMSYPDFVT